ncbi:hypothetical protein CYMTET_12482 [Cymbomonas tetramitiformis]|uniref:C3H1-type domain-containing protein n=1 Tax=Cymbomonas tetramitiformis TaxID=36881 RepID=A0AAE0LCC9_9CHLO|nr:hypothetical protein CYMTET_12482 [Cymbomonas tetramitiformis]
MLNSTIELADEWELEDESEGGGEGSPPSDVDEEEADSPPRRRRPPEHSQRPSARRRPSSSPAAKGKALSKITKAYHLVMTLARRKADNVFNGNFTNDIVQHATGATDGLWCGEGPLSGLHLSLPQPAEAPAPEYCDLVHGVDGQPSAREPVKYSKAEFAYRLIQFARTMPESMDREIHFDITYVVDLITQMSKYDVKCVVDYDKLSTTKKIGEAAAKEGRGAGKSSGGKPTKALVCFQWNAGKCSKKGCKYAHECSKSAKMASLLLTYLTVWNSVDLSEHGVSLEALREFENSTVEMGAAVPKVTEFADRWAVVFQDDPAVNDLVSPVSLGAGWKFNPDSIVMSGKNYLKEAFDFKVDKHHQEELTARRVVPVPEGWARAIHGVGVVDKDHSRSLPREKCLRLRTQVLGLAEKGWARRKDLERLMGQLAFAFRVVNTFADALGRQEWQLFYQLRTEWLRDSVWRKDTDDWQLLRRVFRDLDDRPGVGPFSIDACCDESGPNAQTTNFWTVTQDCLQPDWEGHNAWCNPPFFRILEILQHFLECKRRQNVGTAACFVIPVWPTAGFFKFIEARPTVFFPRVGGDHLDTECHLGSLTSGKAVACTETELRDLEDRLTHYTMNAVAGMLDYLGTS